MFSLLSLVTTAQQESEAITFDELTTPQATQALSDEVESEEETATLSEESSLSHLFLQIQQLERENSYVLGRLEELEHQVQQLRHENRNRYTELDRRIREVSGQATTSPDAISTANPDTESGMYRTAYALIESADYPGAIAGFETMIERYPNGKFVPNAFYWLGELYERTDPQDLEKSRQNFVQLIRLYPEHAKTPEATYKLGTVYHQLGDVPKALEYLDRVINDYPGGTVAKLASDYAEIIR